ncbi:protein homooligomerization, variant 2 [Trebouxia sp. C0009 RCD-2024]
MLAAWFSGRWEHGLDHDDEGRIFLDFDPDLFQPILSFLRSRAICSNPDARPALVGVDASKQRAFADLVKYLALEEYLGYEHDTGSQPLMPSFARASVTATISENRQIATVTRDTGNKWPIILVEPSCSSCCFLKFKITDWPQQPVFVGLGANFDVGKEARYFETAHGWMLGLGGPSCSASCFVKGTMGAHVADRIIKRNGWVLVKADFNSQKLVIRTSESSRSNDIPLEVADHEPLFFAIGLNSVGDHVELLPVTPEDQALFK